MKQITVITGLCALTVSLTLIFATPALADHWALSAAAVGDLVIAERVAPAQLPADAAGPRPAAQLTFILAAEGGWTALAADPGAASAAVGQVVVHQPVLRPPGRPALFLDSQPPLARPYCYTCHLDQ
ncbi:MAG: hypothetical protein KA764_22055 [Anaerolineales bacterium]|nr:hypothetical protein [Anaerolineales bacterium]